MALRGGKRNVALSLYFTQTTLQHVRMTLPVGSHDFVFLLFPPHTYFGRSSNGIGIDIDNSVDIDTNVMRLMIEFQVLSCVHCTTHLTMHPTQLKKKKNGYQ